MSKCFTPGKSLAPNKICKCTEVLSAIYTVVIKGQSTHAGKYPSVSVKLNPQHTITVIITDAVVCKQCCTAVAGLSTSSFHSLSHAVG